MSRSYLFGFCVVLLACGSGAGGFGSGSPDSSTFDLDSGITPGHGGSDATKPSSDATVLNADSMPASSGGSCGPTCSPDLHSVLDCDGKVVKTCPLTEGCSGTTCVAPCAAAIANQSSVGCDYYAATPAEFILPGDGTTYCFAAFVANTWGAPLTVGVEYDGMTLNPSTFAVLPQGSGATLSYTPLPSGQVPANAVAILFLASPGGVCPGSTTSAVLGAAQVSGTGLGSAFHITTSVPAVVYDMFPYGGAEGKVTSASLLLPTSVWDKNYVAVDAYASAPMTYDSQPFVQLVAAQDGTVITFLPSAAIDAGTGVSAAAAGVTQTYTLQKGQLLQFAQVAELSGSIVQANYPFGVWGGHNCMNIDVTEIACDSAHQELPPVKAMGHEYVASRYRDRVTGEVESPPWHIVGAVEGTVLTYDPPTPPTGAPTTLSSGQVTLFEAEGPFVVRSQDAAHPFYMAGHMTGWEHVPNNTALDNGDPEFVNIIPPAQYLSDYVFFTDPTYNNTNLVFVRQKKSSGIFADVTLDCVGTLTGWTPVGTSGQYEYARVDLTIEAAPQGMCSNGRHEAKSTEPFGLTVWGWGFAVSYAYPAGASVHPINAVVVSSAMPK